MIPYYYYFLYFNTYYVSIDQGEKDIPEENAFYYMLFISFFTLIGFCASFINYFDYKVNGLIIAIGTMGIAYLFNRILLSKKKIETKKGHYLFLSEKSKTQRLWISLSVFIICAAVWLVPAWYLIVE